MESKQGALDLDVAFLDSLADPPSSSSISVHPAPPVAVDKKQKDVILVSEDGTRFTLSNLSIGVPAGTYELLVDSKRMRHLIHLLKSGRLPALGRDQILTLYDFYQTFQQIPFPELRHHRTSFQDWMPHIVWWIHQCPMWDPHKPIHQWLLTLQQNHALVVRCWHWEHSISEVQRYGVIDLDLDQTLPIVPREEMDKHVRSKLCIENPLLISHNTHMLFSILRSSGSDKAVFPPRHALFQRADFGLFLWIMYRVGLYYPHSRDELKTFLLKTQEFHSFDPSRDYASIGLKENRTSVQGQNLAWFKSVFQDLQQRYTQLAEHEEALRILLSHDVFVNEWLDVLLKSEMGLTLKPVKSASLMDSENRTNILVSCYVIPEFVVGQRYRKREALSSSSSSLTFSSASLSSSLSGSKSPPSQWNPASWFSRNKKEKRSVDEDQEQEEPEEDEEERNRGEDEDDQHERKTRGDEIQLNIHGSNGQTLKSIEMRQQSKRNANAEREAEAIAESLGAIGSEARCAELHWIRVAWPSLWRTGS